MPTYKRKKKSRLRGSHTHGWGHKKKHRGAGNRGGRGMAGTGKSADHKKPTIINTIGLKNYFGKHGFNRPQKMIIEIKTINVSELSQFKEGELNLKEMGYNKLLGKGTIDKKFQIIIDKFTEKAKKEIEKKGGEIISK